MQSSIFVFNVRIVLSTLLIGTPASFVSSFLLRNSKEGFIIWIRTCCRGRRAKKRKFPQIPKDSLKDCWESQFHNFTCEDGPNDASAHLTFGPITADLLLLDEPPPPRMLIEWNAASWTCRCGCTPCLGPNTLSCMKVCRQQTACCQYSFVCGAMKSPPTPIFFYNYYSFRTFDAIAMESHLSMGNREPVKSPFFTLFIQHTWLMYFPCSSNRVSLMHSTLEHSKPV